MHEESFDNTYDTLTRLNNKDGPNHNVFEPKFEAREQMQTLLNSVTNSHIETPSLIGQVQIARFANDAGLERIGFAARHIFDGNASRVLAHATSGPALQQNLVAVLEGKN